MTISLTGQAKDKLLTRAQELGFPSAEEYVEYLIEDDLNPSNPARDPTNLEALLKEGLASGPGIIADKAFWEEKDRKLDEYIRAKSR